VLPFQVRELVGSFPCLGGFAHTHKMTDACPRSVSFDMNRDQMDVVM
jgi:hypothetical protein